MYETVPYHAALLTDVDSTEIERKAAIKTELENFMVSYCISSDQLIVVLIEGTGSVIAYLFLSMMCWPNFRGLLSVQVVALIRSPNAFCLRL